MKSPTVDNLTSIDIDIRKIKGKFERAQKEDSNNEIKIKILRVFLFGIIKSVELGNYSCAGFLVKNINEYFCIDDIKSCSDAIWRNKENTTPKLGLSENLTKNLSVIFQFSEVSYEYCFQKSMLLIYFQNLYLINIEKKENNTVFNIRDFIESDEDYYYLFDKLVGLNGLYGMISLKEENIKSIKHYETKSKLGFISGLIASGVALLINKN